MTTDVEFRQLLCPADGQPLQSQPELAPGIRECVWCYRIYDALEVIDNG